MKLVWHTIVLAGALASRLPAQELGVRVTAGQLRIAAPNLHFLTGKPLEALRNGASVAFDIQVSILADGRQTVLRRAFDRFVVSYDLWEERFSVTRLRSSRGSASHLTATAAEAWCLDAFSLPMEGLPRDRELHFRVDVRAQNGRRHTEPTEEEGLSLGALIELFSNPARRDPSHWRAESRALTLPDIPKAAS